MTVSLAICAFAIVANGSDLESTAPAVSTSVKELLEKLLQGLQEQSAKLLSKADLVPLKRSVNESKAEVSHVDSPTCQHTRPTFLPEPNLAICRGCRNRVQSKARCKT